jgi:hypothetical protein
VVVVENGLDSQPEKRSLQADSASTALGASPRSTLLKVRALWQDYSPWTAWWLRSISIRTDDHQPLGRLDDAGRQTGAGSLVLRLSAILTDQVAICWSLLLLVTFYNMC